MTSLACPPAFAALLLAALATDSAAQSSATLYGTIDLGIRSVHNGGLGSKTTLSSGGYRISRLGLRGSEELGAGWQAGFRLEALINADTGKLGSPTLAEHFWNRHSYLEIGSGTHGRLRLGYDNTPTHRLWLDNEPWLIGIGSSGNLFDTPQNGPWREVFGPVSRFETTMYYARNMLQYLSPRFGGFSGELAYALREGDVSASGAAGMRQYRLSYDAGPFAAGFSQSRSEAQVVAGGPARRLTDSVASVSYDLDGARLALSWRQFRAAGSKESVVRFTAILPMPHGYLNASYARSRQAGRIDAHPAPGTRAGPIDGNGSTQLALGYVYPLSRRTSLYANVARLSNRGASFLALPGGPPTTAGNFAGGRSTGVDAGITHAF